MAIRYSSWLVYVNQLRNFFVRGSVGTVNGRNVKSITQALHEMVNDGVVFMAPAIHHNIHNPAGVSATAIHAAINLLAATQNIATGITNPDFPRILSVKGNLSGVAGNVTLTGTNIWDAAISEVIALNGASEVLGTKAFKTLTNIALPAQTHTATAQVETATAAGTITLAGNAAVVVTAAGMTGSPKTLNVAVALNDTAADWAAKVRAALAADSAVAAMFAVSGTTTAIILTKLAPAANDATLNVSLDNGTCTGITTAASSADTTAGVAYDTVSVGRGKKFGLKYCLKFAECALLKFFNGSTDAGTVTVDADEVEKNIYEVAGTPDGAKDVDLYYMVN